MDAHTRPLHPLRPEPNRGANTLVGNFAGAMLTLGLFSWATAWTAGLSAGQDRALWPVVMVFLLFVSVLYSAVFAAMAGRRPLPWRYTVGFNALLGLAYLLPMLLHYIPIANPFSSGGFVDRAVRHSWAPLWPVLLFLAVHGLVLYLWRRAARR